MRAPRPWRCGRPMKCCDCGRELRPEEIEFYGIRCDYCEYRASETMSATEEAKGFWSIHPAATRWAARALADHPEGVEGTPAVVVASGYFDMREQRNTLRAALRKLCDAWKQTPRTSPLHLLDDHFVEGMKALAKADEA